MKNLPALFRRPACFTPLLFTLLPLLLCLPAAPLAAQCVSLTTLAAASGQNFDTLSNTAGSTTNNLTITGWFMTESGGGARDNEQYAVDTGGSNTGDTYSYGAAAATDRALGGLQSGTLIPIFGACFTNNTGSTISTLDVAYTGEQWRLGTTARTDQINFEYSTNATDLVTGTWTAVAALNFVSPDTGTTGAKNGNGAANRTALSNSITSLSIANGATFWIRWTDTNASGADDGLSVDDFSLTPQGAGPVTPSLSINDVALAEGNVGTTTFTFTVSLSAPAGVGGVTFDIATADNTATTADNDYVSNSLTGQTIPSGNSTYNFNVTVNGDTTVEANQTFFVNVTNVTGATVTDGQGTGTINNDDVAITPIHDIQGPGASSPIVGSSVTTRGIVTGLRSNGFFIQEPDASVDADPATSEGIFVFTAPPGTLAIGDQAQVTGTVVEFVPSQDPLQPPLTELSSATIVELSAGNPLPAAIALSATLPDPTGAFDQLERYEGMRVSVAAMTVVAPTLGSINEANATATSQGVFFGVVTGVPRAFREAGIQAPDPAPAGSIPPIPRFDTNPEVIRVDSDGLVGTTAINVSVGATLSNVVGPLDYGFRHYTILPESTLVFSGGATATAVAVPTFDEFTVAGFNLQRFFDTVNDPAIGEPVLTTTAFNNRLAKASLAIRDFLQTPDILGVSEVENLTTLQALASQISTDAVGAGDPDPLYQAYLVEGNDVGGIDVGFLVKTSIVTGATPRVNVIAVTQENASELFVNPDTSTELLNDRPPLVLEAEVNHQGGATFPVVVIVNHLRSLNGVADTATGSNGWPTGGDRVRAKRLRQAESLANLVQARQLADPAENIIVLGDFNAFEVNDGYVHSMAVIGGTPVPDNETAVPGDGIDLVNPDLTNLLSTQPAAEQYSYVFDGNAQNLDHLLVGSDLIANTLAQRLEHPRINSDFPETDRNDTTDAIRLSDHDPVVAFFQVAAFAEADLSVTKTDSADPVIAGTSFSYTLTVTNAGPSAAATVALSDTLPAGTVFASLVSPGGWSCTTPAVGSGGTVSCSQASMAVGSAVFTLTVTVIPTTAPGSISNTATVSSTTFDVDAGDLTDSETTTITTQADVSITKTGTPDPVIAGQNITYTLAVLNLGPSHAASVTLADTLPAGTTFVSLASPGGWSCTTPAVGSGGTVNCSNASFALSTANFTLVVEVDAATAPGTVISNTATAASTTSDPDSGDLAATDTVTVIAPADLEAAKTVSGATEPGGTVDYQIVIINNGPAQQGDYAGDELVDVLPAELILSGATASSGTVLVDLGTNTVTWNGVIPAGGTVTIDIMASIDPLAPIGATVSNQATINWDANGDGTNEASATTDDPTTGGGGDPTVFVVGGGNPVIDVPTLDPRALLALVLLIAAVAVFRLRT